MRADNGRTGILCNHQAGLIAAVLPVAHKNGCVKCVKQAVDRQRTALCQLNTGPNSGDKSISS